MDKTVDITPDKSLVSKLGRTGYRTEQAVAELIDNAIDARLDGKTSIEVTLNFRMGRITVSDDGRGMGAKALADAFTIARETGGTGLGRFGMGMKSACSSLGKAFTVTTTEAGSGAELTAEYDEDEWLRDDSRGWESFAIAENAADRKSHGTTVAVSNLRVPLYPNQAPNFRSRFGVRYGPYMEGGQVEITVNGRACKPARQDLREGTRREIAAELPGGRKIGGWVGALDKRSAKGDDGIHLYWNGRLIKSHAKFGVRDHPEVAGIVGALSLDHVPVNFHKTGFIEESPLYAEAEEWFRKSPALADALRACARKSGKPDARDAFAGPKALEARMGMGRAESFLRGAKGFAAEKGGFKMDVSFGDGGGGIYETEKAPGGARIRIERDSPAFRAFRNPLLLLGWIGIEAELLASGPRDAEAFVRERNRRWAEFAKESLPREAAAERPRKIRPRAPGYSLADDLVGLHDELVEDFRHRFQFTAASTLSPFMRISHAKAVYTLHVARGTGDQMAEAIGGEFVALLNPASAEVYTALDLGHDRIVVVRERSERMPETWAPPEKAWLDLYRESTKGNLTMYADELDWVLEDLVDKGLASTARIKSLARRYGMARDIEAFLEE